MSDETVIIVLALGSFVGLVLLLAQLRVFAIHSELKKIRKLLETR